MSVKKLSFYIDTAKITVRSDHLPLKKFLEKNTMNSKVNNWAVELESQNITFEYIPRIKNTLADTLSRLIDIDENIKLQPEEEGKEFGYFPFEELPPAQTQMVEEITAGEIGTLSIHHTEPTEIDREIQLPLKDKKLVKLQESDPHIRQLRKQQSGYQQLHHGKQHPKMKTCRQRTPVHTHSSPRHTERLPTDPST